MVKGKHYADLATAFLLEKEVGKEEEGYPWFESIMIKRLVWSSGGGGEDKCYHSEGVEDILYRWKPLLQ